MLISILIGAAALVAVCLCFSLFLFAYLTGRVRRATALRVSVLGLALGAVSPPTASWAAPRSDRCRSRSACS